MPRVRCAGECGPAGDLLECKMPTGSSQEACLKGQQSGRTKCGGTGPGTGGTRCKFLCTARLPSSLMRLPPCRLKGSIARGTPASEVTGHGLIERSFLAGRGVIRQEQDRSSDNGGDLRSVAVRSLKRRARQSDGDPPVRAVSGLPGSPDSHEVFDGAVAYIDGFPVLRQEQGMLVDRHRGGYCGAARHSIRIGHRHGEAGKPSHLERADPVRPD